MSASEGQRPAPPDAPETLPPLSPSAAMRWDVVRRRLPPEPGDVLEIGCGRGGTAARLLPLAGSLVAIEPDAASFAAASAVIGHRSTVLNIDSGALPADWTFDTVCAFEVLEHLEDDRAAFADWAGRLRPGGTILISVPAHAVRMGAADVLVGHFRRYDTADVQRLMEQAGLVDIDIALYGFPFGYAMETGRNLIARRKLRQRSLPDSRAQRTAASGRLLQPGRGVSGALATLASWPMIRCQRFFPNHGPGLVASARRPV